jgi:hypothetical protein
VLDRDVKAPRRRSSFVGGELGYAAVIDPLIEATLGEFTSAGTPVRNAGRLLGRAGPLDGGERAAVLAVINRAGYRRREAR